MFRNIKYYMGRPILTKQLLNTASDKEKVTINYRSELLCFVELTSDSSSAVCGHLELKTLGMRRQQIVLTKAKGSL